MKRKNIVKSVVAALLASALATPALFAQPAPRGQAVPAKVDTVAASSAQGNAASPAAKGSPAGSKLARRAEFSRESTPGRAASTIPVGMPVAVLQRSVGDVLVSAQSGLVAGAPGVLLRQGQSLITMVKSSAVVKFKDGCEITLKPSHRLEVSMSPPCEERIELAESTLIDLADLQAALEGSTASIPAMALSGAFPAGSIAGTGLAGVGALAAAAVQDTASPN
jgi:hypothetical protein